MMEFTIVKKEAFSVIGKEGSTNDGKYFVKNLWKESNMYFNEIIQYAKCEKQQVKACWGLMSDYKRQFLPWENDFSEGLYLAGVECESDAEVENWVRWDVPAMTYFVVDCGNGYPFKEGLEALHHEGYQLVGAAFDYTDLISQKNYIYYPIER